jgi:hypothetical protein
MKKKLRELIDGQGNQALVDALRGEEIKNAVRAERDSAENTALKQVWRKLCALAPEMGEYGIPLSVDRAAASLHQEFKRHGGSLETIRRFLELVQLRTGVFDEKEEGVGHRV